MLKSHKCNLKWESIFKMILQGLKPKKKLILPVTVWKLYCKDVEESPEKSCISYPDNGISWGALQHINNDFKDNS